MSNTKIYINDKKIKNANIKVAITSKEQQLGLMYTVDVNHPIMIFPYKFAAVRKFWMKNTYIPLDIVFCKDGQIVNISAGQPLKEDLVGPNLESDVVVEFPFGYCKENNIKIGDAIKIKYDKLNLKKLLIQSNE